MQNWKELEISTIYLANGKQVRAPINGISLEDLSAYDLIHVREVKVGPLPDMWSALGYGEIVPITLQSGETISAVLSPDDYLKHVAYLYRDNDSIEATICVFDQSSGSWREMTDQEYEQERRAWEADGKDMAQIQQEWRAYRNEGVGERG